MSISIHISFPVLFVVSQCLFYFIFIIFIIFIFIFIFIIIVCFDIITIAFSVLFRGSAVAGM